MNTKSTSHTHDHHDYSLIGELVCHLPYAIFSVSLGLIVLSFMSVLGVVKTSSIGNSGFHALFHSFHFLHIIFAATGSLVTFSRFSRNLFKGFVVALLSALFFCTLSDIILPYFAGQLLGVSMHFHVCLWSEFHNIVPFLGIGLLNGLIMSQHASTAKAGYSLISHFGHIFASSLASLFYLIAEGYTQWAPQMGLLFLLLICAVVIPCTLADVVVPVYFARSRKVDEKYPPRKD